MDEKPLTAVSTSLALFQIQLNALLLLLEHLAPTAQMRDEFQRLVDEGVHILLQIIHTWATNNGAVYEHLQSN